MIHFKSCVRCGGDVHVAQDFYGEFASCVQCGWTRDIGPDPLSALAETVRTKRPAARLARAG